MTKINYLIVGCSHAGLAAAEAIRAIDKKGSITILSREDTLPYSPTILPYVISGEKTKDAILLRNPDYFANLDITFQSNTTVASVDTDRQVVLLDSRKQIGYQKLLLATGANAAIPSFQGVDKTPYHVVRTLADAQHLRESMLECRSAIVIGAGLIAFHSAENLAQADLEVTIIVRRKISLFSYFDGAAAGMIERIFADHGVTIATGSGVKRLDTSDHGCEVHLESGDILTADLLVLATGIRPRIEYLKAPDSDSRVKNVIKTDQGILVDNKMRTNVSWVWAAGDVAQAPDFFTAGKIVSATLPNASVQGRLAGMDMVSDATLKPYTGSSGLNTFNFFGNHGFSLGQATLTESEKDVEVNTQFLPSTRRYQKLIFKGNQLIGVSAINSELDPGVLRELIQQKTDLSEVKEQFTKAPLETGRLLMSRLWR